MIKRNKRAAQGSSPQLACGSVPTGGWANALHDTVTGLRITLHHTVMISGIAAMGALALIFFRPEMMDFVKDVSPFAMEEQAATDTRLEQMMGAAMQPAGLTTPEHIALAPLGAIAPTMVKASLSPAAGAVDATLSQQQRVTTWISKRYRVAGDATNMLVSAAYLTAREIKIDPLLILAVMAIESRFNPFAESPVGAKGLMQVMAKIHHDKFAPLGGQKAALNPLVNIRVGSLILKDYVRRGGSVEAGLKMYVGAAEMETDQGYGNKVLAEYARLKQVAGGKNIPVSANAAVATKKSAPAADTMPEALTKADTAADEQPV